MRDYAVELQNRTAFIRKALADSGCGGVIFANSGGKDAVLTGILCKKACDDTVGLVLPCGSRQNFGSDMADAALISGQFGIESRTSLNQHFRVERVEV